MGGDIVVSGLALSLRVAPCAHICRYCSIEGTRRATGLEFARFELLVHRFLDWKAAHGRDDIEISFFVGPSFDYDIDILRGVGRLRARLGWTFRILNLGGLRTRNGAGLESWLQERQAAGIEGFHASFAGCGEIHDRWNGRAGDFAYQTSILRMGGERGMVRHERIFLAQNTLPVIDRLLDALEHIPGEVRDRYACPFFYSGLARRHESERITEDIRDTLPERVRKLRLWKFGEWRSEREWIPLMKEKAGLPRKVTLELNIGEANIDRIEALSCDEIFAEKEQECRENYRRMPGIDELCTRYADPNDRRIYMLDSDLERKWMDRHRLATSSGAPSISS